MRLGQTVWRFEACLSHVGRRDDHQAERHAETALECERERMALLLARRGSGCALRLGRTQQGGRVQAGRRCLHSAGLWHAIKNVGTEDLEIVQTWDNGKFEEIDLIKWVQSSPGYLFSNNFAGVPETTISRLT